MRVRVREREKEDGVIISGGERIWRDVRGSFSARFGVDDDYEDDDDDGNDCRRTQEVSFE